MEILCGDVGGTNTRLALWSSGRLLHELHWPSLDFDGLEGPVRAWLAASGARPDRACFAVAGPVREQRCVTTNLPWIVDGPELTALLGVPVRIVNDFHAAARGVTVCPAADLVPLGGGERIPGHPVGVLGAGTGLGEAILVGDEVVPGEGGHADFGPADAREARFAAWLVERYGRAEWEDVLCGKGLVNLTRFHYEDRGQRAPAWLDSPDAPARVTATEPAVVDWFCALYGAEAGNVALRVLARGGVFLCGGIAPRILPQLRAGGFRRRFEAKGKLGEAIRDIPVYVATHPALGLLGAAEEALRLRD
jgi:glucokinase